MREPCISPNWTNEFSPATENNQIKSKPAACGFFNVWAWHYKVYEREQLSIDRKVYADAENEARAARRGLWADAEPVPPWDYRKAKREP